MPKVNDDIFAVARTRCFYCGGDQGLIMNSRLTKNYADKIRECDGKVVNMEPCSKCEEYMKKGVILIEVLDNTDRENPYRTGGFAVLTEEGIKRCFPPEQAEIALKHRWCFVEQSIWKAIGLDKLVTQEA